MMKVRAAQRAQYMGSEEFSWSEILIELRDPKLYLRLVLTGSLKACTHRLTIPFSGAIQFCQDILLYGFSTFLPSIIQGLGYDSLQTQYMTIPVYICGGLSFLLAASFSDRWGIRGPFVFLTNIPGIIGYILILCPTPNGVKFFGTFLCSIAVYNGPGLNLTWLNVNVAPHYRRAAAIGFQQTIGNTAGGKFLLYILSPSLSRMAAN